MRTSPETLLSPAEPVRELRHVPIRECGEPLVDFLQACPHLLLDRPRFRYRREALLRLSVAERLGEATRHLPPGFRLAVIEGWRAPHIQERMYRAVWRWFAERHPDWSELRLKRTVNRFTAPLDRRVPPPHTTGGAVDVTLLQPDGKPADVFSPLDWQDPLGFPMDSPHVSPTARENRRILNAAMLAGGLTNYPSEYWHWSYGDQGWAYRGRRPHALYAAITPPGWSPAPEDLSEDALEFVI